MGVSRKQRRSRPAAETAPGASDGKGAYGQLRRKNLILDQTRIDRARTLLGAGTETETITRALDTVLDLAAFRQEVDSGLAEILGKGGFRNYFDDPKALDWRGFDGTAKRARRKRP